MKIVPGLVLAAFGIGSPLAGELPRVAKEHPRGTLEGYERLRVYPEIQYRASPITASTSTPRTGS